MNNTIREDLEKILNFYADEVDMNKVTDQILTLLDKSLPKKKPIKWGLGGRSTNIKLDYKKLGWNDCLKEIKDKLK